MKKKTQSLPEFKRPAFNKGKGYHGSSDMMNGNLKGASDTDYFYFFCPECPDSEIMRILEYGEHQKPEPAIFNEHCKSIALYSFVLVFKIHCEKCGLTDFVKIGNRGFQFGKIGCL